MNLPYAKTKDEFDAAAPDRKYEGGRVWWLIQVGGYGAFPFCGTDLEAEAMRTHKSRWENGAGWLRLANEAEVPE